MSLERIESTSLWEKSLAVKPKDKYSKERDELRASFIKFRENTSHLVSKIASHLPGLTQHEISHLDALWEIASLIAGDKFPLNPIEGFVLGGAILLHDSALCFEAYDNGIEGVRATTTWKDAYAALLDNKRNIPDNELKAEADFTALRHLHASQAEVLAEKSWLDPDTKQPVYLIENATLRKHLGQLIGQIAASHHWDIEKVANLLPEQVNSLSVFPKDWRIDPVKIACLLRCADAAHIDNERAPDFLHALLKRKGISFNHWQAQNRLSCVDLDQSDPTQSTLLFTSTRSFKESESESWWVIFDATVLVDKEIRACNALLESRTNNNTFQVKRVKGVESPELMAKHIKVNGWTPCTAEIHVGNVEKLVQNLGGEKMYGAGVDLLEIAIRELIQNARDAIKAREVIETDFKGKITVKILQEKEETWLIVEDNGVGMSERVLTGPLLDFGISFWTSSLVQSEFPGLRSSKFKAVGQFGIGFYSVFMIAEEVYVTTKPWKEGVGNAHQLLFKNGLSLRPLLKKGPFENFNSTISTQIIIRLKPNTLPTNLHIEVDVHIVGEVNFNVPFEDYVSAICAGLDVDVYLSNRNAESQIHHNIEDHNFDPKSWLSRISFSEYKNSDTVSKYIDTYVNRLRPIRENGRILGLATISTEFTNEQRFLNIKTVGGLGSVRNRDNPLIVGFIDYLPRSAARREGSDYAVSKDIMLAWAQEQFDILKDSYLTPIQRYIAASGLAHFKVDPTPIACIPVIIDKTQQFLTFDQLAETVEKTSILILKASYGDIPDLHNNIPYIDGYAWINQFSVGNFITLKMNGNIPENNNSIIDCLHRAILKNGKTPIWTLKKSVAQSHLVGYMDALIVSVAHDLKQ